MKDKKILYNRITILLLGILLCITIFNGLISNYVLSINNFFAIILWITLLGLEIFKVKYSIIPIIIILVLFSTSLINFMIDETTISFGIQSSGRFHVLKFNVIGCIILIVYLLLNRETIKSYFYSSPKEELNLFENRVSTYYKTFSSCSEEEIIKAISIIEQYPIEAQSALNKIISERNI